MSILGEFTWCRTHGQTASTCERGVRTLDCSYVDAVAFEERPADTRDESFTVLSWAHKGDDEPTVFSIRRNEDGTTFHCKVEIIDRKAVSA